MIDITNLSKNFGKMPVLRSVNLTFTKGECVALIGPNGCGKTTLIKSILSMVIPSEGKIAVFGESITNNFAYRRHIGYMPQIGRYPDNMTIRQVIDMVKDIRASTTKNRDIATDESLIEDFHLAGMEDKRMRTLSGGTTQKVSATLAFLFKPDIIILDEPTAGLDPLSSEVLKDKILTEKQKGKLTLITSHLLSELDDLVTSIVFMQDGAVRFHKSVDDLKNFTGEEKISKAIATILKNQSHE